jgi:colicin import membrane protein
MKIDWTISALGHVALLAFGLVSFGARPLETPPEGLPVDIVSEKQFSQIMAGNKKAAPAPKPKPLVEKIAEKKPVEDPTPKISEKKEIKEAKVEPPPTPEPRPKPPDPKPPEAKKEPPKPPDPKPAEAKKEPKVDEIAEALKKAEAAKKRDEARQAREKAELEKKKKLEQERHFDPAKVAALLDKRTPQRQAATGEALNSTASLGLPSATAAQLSQSEIDALRARLAQLWNPPAGASNPDELVVRVRVHLSRDGRLIGGPQVLTSGSSVLFMTARDSAIRALFRGQPFDMLRPEHYDQWKDIEITFDPRDMMRG